MKHPMAFIVDGILILLLISTIARCAQLGLVRSLAGIIALVAAAAIALQCSAPLAVSCYDRFLHDRVVAAAEENIRSAADATETAELTKEALDGLPDVVVRAAESMGVDVDALRQQTQELPQSTAEALEREILAPVLKAALTALLFLITVVVITALAQVILTPVCGLLHKTPVIGKTDRALGAVFGLLKGAILVGVLAVLLRVAGGVIAGEFGRAVDSSAIVSFVSDSPFADGLFR